jgi:hypothetical protein
MTPSDASAGLIDPEQLPATFRRWVGRILSALRAEIEAIDGKTISYSSCEVGS